MVKKRNYVCIQKPGNPKDSRIFVDFCVKSCIILAEFEFFLTPATGKDAAWQLQMRISRTTYWSSISMMCRAKDMSNVSLPALRLLVIQSAKVALTAGLLCGGVNYHRYVRRNIWVAFGRPTIVYGGLNGQPSILLPTKQVYS